MKNIYWLLVCFGFILGAVTNGFAIDGDSTDAAVTKNTLLNIEKIQKYLKSIKRTKPAYNPYILGSPDDKGEGDDIGIPITFTGSFRFCPRYRNLYENWPASTGVHNKSLEMNGFGNSNIDQQPVGTVPMLNFGMNIIPTPGLDMYFGIGMMHTFAGTIDPDSTKGRLSFGQTFGGSMDYKTKIGNIKIGGGNLYTGSSRLFSGWPSFRFNSFYRLPWDVSTQWGGSWNKYEGYYKDGSNTKVDPRYANGGRTQGVIVQFSELPGNFGANFSYGVNAQTGQYMPDTSTTKYNKLAPTKATFGARIYNKYRKHTFGVTYISNSGYIENVTNLKETQQMYSADALLEFNKILIDLEVGATSFTNPYGKFDGDSANNKWSPTNYTDKSVINPYNSGLDYLGQLKISIDKSKFGIPLNLTLYNLGANYINSNSGTFNASTYNYAAAYVQNSSQWDIAIRRGFIADIGQTANNRRAYEFQTSIEKGRFKLNIATQVGQEIQKSDSAHNQVMFYQKVNAWSRAGFNYWTPIGGPYGRILSNYINLLERVSITDAVVNYRKTFNVFDLDARYKSTFLGRSVILNNYTSYSSSSAKFSPVPYFTKNAFIRSLYDELTGYYQLKKNTTLVGQASYSKAVANYHTTLAENGRPINQDTWAFGAGIDWEFSPMCGLYFRELWMTHTDRNFKLDHFEGFETMLELKVMF